MAPLACPLTGNATIFKIGDNISNNMSVSQSITYSGNTFFDTNTKTLTLSNITCSNSDGSQCFVKGKGNVTLPVITKTTGSSNVIIRFIEATTATISNNASNLTMCLSDGSNIHFTNDVCVGVLSAS